MKNFASLLLPGIFDKTRVRNGNKVWIVGQWKEIWEFQGVFLTEQEAVDACVEDNYFVAPAILGKSLQKETIKWPGFYYPSKK